MQMSDSPLAQAGRDYFNARDAQVWTGLLRPGFHLRALTEGADESVAAYLGGLPLLPEDVDWPEWKDHGPLYFVAALDCSQLPAADLGLPLPASGQLLFFYSDGLGDSSVVYSDPDSVVNGTRVLYIPEDAEIAERAAPDGMTPYPRLFLTGETIATAPDNENAALSAAFGNPSDPSDYTAYPTVDPEGTGFWEALDTYRRDHRPLHQIGGYATPVQGAVEFEGAHTLYQGSNVSDAVSISEATTIDVTDTPGEAIVPGESGETAIRALASQLVLLAQIDGDARSGMSWGDTGRLYWMIRRDDLAAGRFDKATFTWQTE